MIKKLLFLVFALFLTSIIYAQISRTSEVVTGGSTSSAGSAPYTGTRYQRVAYLIPASELNAPTVGINTNAIINKLGFVFAGSSEIAVTGTFKVWLQNTSDVTYTKSTTIAWAAAGGVTDGMTLVHDGTITLPAHTTVVDVTFSGTANTFTYTGTNIYVAFEFTNVSGTLPLAVNNAYCNSSTAPTGSANGLRRSISTTAMPTTAATSSAFRPYTRLGFTHPTTGATHNNDAEVVAIYTYGSRPISSTTNNQVRALIRNNGNNNLTNLSVTLNRFGTNTFTNTKQVNITAGNYSLVTFDGDNPSTTGLDSIKVTVPSDNVDSNNAKSVPQFVNSNTYALTYGYNTGVTATTATTATEHLMKFNTTSSITLDSVTSFYNTPAVGATYTITLRKATADGLPEAVPVWESTAQTPTGGGVANRVAILPVQVVDPTTYLNGDFYIGIRQTGTTSISLFAQQNVEFPLRPNSVYTSGSAVGALNSFIAGNLNKFYIEPRFTVVTPVTFNNFSGTKQNAINNLTWTTSTEQNNAGFYLERSADGKNFSSLEFIASKAVNGNSNSSLTYVFPDTKPLKGDNYYRLKQVDKDGKSAFSSIVLLRADKKGDLQISSIYPNPVKSEANLVITAPASDKISIAVVDMAGKLITQLNTQVVSGDNMIKLNTSGLASGTYSVKVICSNGCEAAPVKMVKF